MMRRLKLLGYRLYRLKILLVFLLRAGWRKRFVRAGRPHISGGESQVFDVIITWVDGEDRPWRTLRDSCPMTAEEARFNPPCRFFDYENLRFALRSLDQHVGGVGKIHIVTACELPRYLGSERLVVVRDQALARPAEPAPYYNSIAIESCLHRMPQLAEHFVAMNDDFFLTKPIGFSDFFAQGQALYQLSRTPATFFPYEFEHRSELVNDINLRVIQNARRFLQKKFGEAEFLVLEHAPLPFFRSVLEEFDLENPEVLNTNRSFRFRNPRQYGWINFMAPYLHVLRGRGAFRALHWDYRHLLELTPEASAIRQAFAQVTKRDLAYFSTQERMDETEFRHWRSLILVEMAKLFPRPSPFEKI